MMSCSH